MAGGAYLFTRAGATTQIWAATRTLAAGSVLSADDVRPVAARIPGGAYVPASESVVGRTLAQPVGAGELLAHSSVTATAPATKVTIPFDARSAPPLARGQRIKVWVSAKGCAEVPLLQDVTVQDVAATGGTAFSSGQGQAVVVRVPDALADRVVTALALNGAVLRAGVLEGQAGGTSNDALPSLAGCSAA
jgi:hypothetical protein